MVQLQTPSWDLAHLFLEKQGFRLDSIQEAEPSEHEGQSKEYFLNPASLINCNSLIVAKRIRYNKRTGQTGRCVPLSEHPTSKSHT